MLPRQKRLRVPAAEASHASLPVVCIVTADDEFLNVVPPEVLPWFQVVVRENYDDLARWTGEARVSAVLLDVDTKGRDPHGGLSVLNELHSLNRDLALISLSRAPVRAIEKRAYSAGADAHF